ncbi:class I SAM-dependent methyltransferase [Streptomyces sp. VNUA116]|uniref:class I SAM-dependent methyltransferase n=1 Tax=Streptomyces sp. VNUA116 TaxID=3062449 RepID=UPI0026749937|nr:class I SAM-dependent methyltransferase [Streptomyces sp. VNUA116]WKU43083.1 class I SAM-dependent methyltransferase [Streptomyces sp. VNUA116]
MTKRAEKAETAEKIAALRPLYQKDLASGVERFFAPRRTTCPWCASDRLRERVRTIDLLQHKPGAFVIDGCRACGHHFQNPQLTDEGLEFYYRDCYDGLGAEAAQSILGASRSLKRHRAVARSLRPFTSPETPPERWLDVGTGHGYFPQMAGEVFPDTVFEGLDQGEGVEIAVHEGRIKRALRGSFTDLAPSLAGTYDVVTMHHYLEHTPDPRAQLRAAHTALRAGGLLHIEVPDPESAYARVLGRWWLPWFQPQHLNMAPARNLRRALEECGFTVVAAERPAAHRPVDLSAALLYLLSRLMPRADAPWHPRPPSAAARFVRAAMWRAALPAVVAVYGLDLLLSPLARRVGFSNAYRLLARRN